MDLTAAIDREITRWWASWPPLPRALSQGACTDPQISPELFFPPGGGHQASGPAHTICDGCEVSQECLDWAVRVGVEYGVWGGAGPKARRDLRVTDTL